MHLAERLFLPFHLAHYFSAFHLFMPSQPLCFLHMLASLTSIFFLIFTRVHLLMHWSCSLSFQLPPSTRNKYNPLSFPSPSPTLNGTKEKGCQCCPLYSSLGHYYLAQYHQERSTSLKLTGSSLLSLVFRAHFKPHHLQLVPSAGTPGRVRGSDFTVYFTGSFKSLRACPTPEAQQEGTPRNPTLTSCLPPD